jgi:glycosyltransferase involved in cell wall biosynthesis
MTKLTACVDGACHDGVTSFPLPFPVSIGVPVRNERESLPLLLESLLAQTHPPAEIVIADGGSTDDTVEIARRYVDRGVRILELGPAYPGRGRNKAIEAATHDWIALIDAGCCAHPRWLEELIRAVDLKPEVRVVYGNYEPRLTTEWDIAQALVIVPAVDAQTGSRPPFIASSLVHRSAWRAAGAFPEHLRAAEDLLFFEGVSAARVAVARAPKAMIDWRPAPGPGAVFRRFRLYSAHHVAAGLFDTWHRRVLMLDAAAIVLIAASFASRWFLAILALAALARLASTAWKRRHAVPAGSAFRPDRLLRGALLLLIVDAAACLGWLDYRKGRVAS